MAFLLGSLVVGVLAGPVHLGVGAVLESAAAKLHVPGVTSPLSPTEEAILWQIRVPRVVLAALVGSMLALAGATYQGVFRNPLADPYLLGVAAGAGLGATIAIAYLPDGLRGQRMLPVAAFVGGAVAVFLTYAVGRSARRERDAATLVLAGVTVTAFFTAWQTFVQQQNAETLQEVYSWILGNIPSTGLVGRPPRPPLRGVAAVVVLALRRVVDVLNLGDDEAASLGVDVRRVRLALVVAATLGTAAAVAVTGLIGFVGIIVPHAIRLLTGVGYRRAPPALRRRRGRVPRARGRRRPDGALARRAPARRRDRVLRRAVLRARPAHDAGRHGVDRAPGRAGRPSAAPASSTACPRRRRRGVARADRPERRGEDDPAAGDRAPRPLRRRDRARRPPVSELGRSELARHVAVVPQEPLTPPWMTVGEYVLLGRTPHLGPLAKEGRRDREAAARALARLDLLAFGNRRLGTLAAGRSSASSSPALSRRRRPSCCSTSRPRLSTSGISSRRSTCSTACASSRADAVAAMHDLTLAARYADRMLLLDRGRIVADGPAAEVLTEALLSEHYGASVEVVSVGGRPVVVPADASGDT